MKTSTAFDRTFCDCSVCDDFRAAGVDGRIPAAQHAKETGHTVRIYREVLEAIAAEAPPLRSAEAAWDEGYRAGVRAEETGLLVCNPYRSDALDGAS